MRFRSKEGARHSVRRIQGLSQIESSVITLQAFLLTNSAKLAGFGRVTTERSNGRTQQGTHFSALARTDSAEFGKLENRSAARPLWVRIPPPPPLLVIRVTRLVQLSYSLMGDGISASRGCWWNLRICGTRACARQGTFVGVGESLPNRICAQGGQGVEILSSPPGNFAADE
jgi:hypothetical protein